MTITARVKNELQEFNCNAVLYDSELNKLDEKPFAFNTTGNEANIIHVDNEVPIGESEVTQSDGKQCEDTSITHI